MRDSNSPSTSQDLATFILTRLKKERLPVDHLPRLPPSIQQGSLSDTTIAQDSPELNLDLVEAQLKSHAYSSMEAFDRHLYQLFLRAERAYQTDPDRLAGIYVLKRLYQELTQGNGTQTLKDSFPVGTAKKLASVTMGPGNRSHLPRNDEPVKLRAKDKILLEGIHLKGDYLRIGDWVHLFNPDDPSRPIIGQIFNTYRRVDNGRRSVNVCWYYRPEETVHYISRTFMANEVFKTGNFIDHVVEDIMGRCLVLFYTKYVRGRPSAPHWTPDMPTYICEHRYKDDVYSFKKIKNWDSCAPSNIRNEATEENFQPFPNPQLVSSLVRLPSPFLSPASDRHKGSGEPIVAGPQEVEKELPKDQMKCHDLNLSLSEIEQILGQLPTNPPRRPHGTEATKDSTQATRSPNILSNHLTLPPTTKSSSTPPALASTSSPIAPSSVMTAKAFDLASQELAQLLDQSNGGRIRKRPPCLLDLIASQDCFEKLPEKLFDRSDSSISEDPTRPGELVWFPCLPSSRALKTPHQVSHPSPSILDRRPVQHSQVYLDWLKDHP